MTRKMKVKRNQKRRRGLIGLVDDSIKMMGFVRPTEAQATVADGRRVDTYES